MTNPLTAYMDARTEALECVSRIYAEDQRNNRERWLISAHLHDVARAAAKRAIKDLHASVALHDDQVHRCLEYARTQRAKSHDET
ncbi:MAG: hypothetical protein HC888_12255 [Candidatus Competibacteraceae bacterium]|nr:hypothetical protein [Candidatus Competibacteraceae bacterium]